MTALPASMTAIEIVAPGAPEVLRPTTRPVPKPGPGEVLIAVVAAGVNRPDVAQREGHYAPPPGVTDIPGLEVAGEVVALGTDAGRWRVGDKVTALVSGGGYAEYCAAPAVQCLPVPEGLSLLQAAALPETFFTVWSNVFERGALKPGESFLVHGGSSGIGTTAIQLARHFGARVFATAGSEAKVEVCRELGAEIAINYREADFVAVLKEATARRGVDVILDMVGGDYIPRNLSLLAPDGRLVQIAFLKGAKVAEMNFMMLMLKRLTVTGSTLRPRSVAEKGALAAVLEARVWPLLAAGTVRPVMDRSFPLAEAAQAHARMESSRHIGKIMLEVS